MKKRFLAFLSVLVCVSFCSCGQASVTDKIGSDGDITTSSLASATSSETLNETPTDAEDTNDSSTVPVEGQSVRLVMVGDILMHDPVLESGRIDGSYNYDHIFENVADTVSSADIALFNQEVIIAGEEYGVKGYPKFNAPFELADAIEKAGFDVAVHASNHTLDLGKQAMLDCLSNWENEHPDIEVVGMHDSPKDAEHVSVIEKKGIKIAILNYTDIMNLVGVEPQRQEPYLVDMFEENKLRADVKKARELADLVVVCAHWGTEYTHNVSSSQRKWAEIMLECGVDLVLGTHPHVIQPIEWLEDEDGSRMLVYWSLGNFVNSTGERGAGKGARMLGAMADVSIVKENGAARIEYACAVPLVTHVKYEARGITTYLFSDYTEQMLLESEARSIDYTFSYDYCERTFARVLGDFVKK